MSRADFWTRRKEMVREEAEAAFRKEEETSANALSEKPDQDILEELGLPDPDTLELGDDFKAFMSKAVPDRLRRRALRKLWLSNPALANLDGLLDYGEDFTDGATVIENLQTAYQVGKGMTAHIEEMARQTEDDPDEAEDTELAMLDPGEQEPIIEFVEPDPEEAQEEPLSEDFVPARPGRMRFAFDDLEGGAA